jgi:hypothetical protein
MYGIINYKLKQIKVLEGSNMLIKYHGQEYEITTKDIILDNGACYQLVNRITYSGSGLELTKKTFQELKKNNQLEMIKESFGLLKNGIRYWRIKE